MATGAKKASQDSYGDYATAIQLVQAGEHAKAQALLEKIRAAVPGDIRLGARIETYLKICQKALLPEIAVPEDPEAAYDLGVFSHNRGDFEGARRFYKAALKRAGETESAHTLIAMAATEAKTGDRTAALTYLKKALQIEPSLRFQAQGDRDFEGLRQTDPFKRLIESAS